MNRNEKAGEQRRKFNALVGFILAFGCLITGGILFIGMLDTGNNFYGLFGLWNIAVYVWICLNIPKKPNETSEPTLD